MEDMIIQFFELHAYALIAAIVIGAIIAYALPIIVIRRYARSSNREAQSLLREVIYKLDEFADEMENKEKRSIAIDKLGNIISFKGITLPKFIRGWIVDFEVRHIRYLQSEADSEGVDTNLHDEKEGTK